MPLYSYECSNCKEVIEALQSFSDLPLTDCPSCESKDTLSKLVSSSTSFRLKGRHWYRRTTTLD